MFALLTDLHIAGRDGQSPGMSHKNDIPESIVAGDGCICTTEPRTKVLLARDNLSRLVACLATRTTFPLRAKTIGGPEQRAFLLARRSRALVLLRRRPLRRLALLPRDRHLDRIEQAAGTQVNIRTHRTRDQYNQIRLRRWIGVTNGVSHAFADCQPASGPNVRANRTRREDYFGARWRGSFWCLCKGSRRKKK